MPRGAVGLNWCEDDKAVSGELQEAGGRRAGAYVDADMHLVGYGQQQARFHDA
jgi:hypothetical protein